VPVLWRRFDIGAALEPIRRFGREPQPLARSPDGDRLEPGALECNEIGRSRHLAVGAAHDPADGLRPVGVGDDQYVGRERPVLFVERRDPLSGTRRPDADLAPAEPLEVERVHRVPELDQDVVGDVHDVVDRADAGGSQPLLHPRGRGTDTHLGSRRAVAGASRRVFDRDLQVARARGIGGLEGGDRRHPERGVVQRGHLAGDAHHAQAVGTVRRDLQIDHRVFDGIGAAGRWVYRRDLEARHVQIGRQRRRWHRHVHELTQP
jgi:hypothetical protein